MKANLKMPPSLGGLGSPVRGGKGIRLGLGVRESFVDMSPCLEENSFDEFDLDQDLSGRTRGGRKGGRVESAEGSGKAES